MAADRMFRTGTASPFGGRFSQAACRHDEGGRLTGRTFVPAEISDAEGFSAITMPGRDHCGWT
jgi:hypothetical protein